MEDMSQEKKKEEKELEEKRDERIEIGRASCRERV